MSPEHAYDPPSVTNDGRYPDEADVEVWYPAPGVGLPARDDWQWYPAYVVSQVGPDEWEVVVEHGDFVRLDEDGETVYPVCYRDASELRPRQQRDTNS